MQTARFATLNPLFCALRSPFTTVRRAATSRWAEHAFGMPPGTQALVETLQRKLQAAASAEVARGQDAYFKGVIRHRGLKTPAVDAVAKQFVRQATAEQVLSVEQLRQLGLALLREPLQEDKLCGLGVWQHCLLKGGLAQGWRGELVALEELFTGGHVFAWSTCDSICGRLLGPLIKQLLAADAAEGEACSRAVMGWCQRRDVWLRRTSVVAFVTLARKTDAQVFPGFRQALVDTLAVTVGGPERFAQTGTGWVLRELGKGDADQMVQFVEAHLRHFSREGLRYALEHQPSAVRTRLLEEHKRLAGQGENAQAASSSIEPGAGTGGGGGSGGTAASAAKRQRR